MSDTYHEYAWLYDAAFSWDVREEVLWLLDRFGPDATSVLEPACGSGRLLAGLARTGLCVAGFDRSSDMLERARARFSEAGLPAPQLLVGDLLACGSLTMGGPFDGAVMPLGTFGYLPTDEDALCHLEGMSRQLRSGARYLVQFEVHTLAAYTPRAPGPTCQWDTPTPRGTLRCTVSGRDWDPQTRMATEISRYEILDGPEAGFVHEDEHHMRVWDWASWEAAIHASPFRQTASYDGNSRAREALPLGSDLEDRALLWHELTLRA